MDKKTFAIGVLSITGLLLFLAQFMPLTQPALAADSARDRDWQVVTARQGQGGDALYIADNRTGLVAVYSWDANARTLKLRAVRSINDAILR